MSTITLTSRQPAAGVLAKVVAAWAQVFAARRAAAAFASMSEREYQDIGWGQMDRHPKIPVERETPPERRARALAVAAWHKPLRKAA